MIDWDAVPQKLKTHKTVVTTTEFLSQIKILGFDAVCAGGFVRDVIIGRQWMDIDIFVAINTEKDQIKIGRVLASNIYRYMFQVIYVYTDNLIEHIRTNFDFTCCCVGFDAEGTLIFFNDYTREALKLKILEKNSLSTQNFQSQHCVRHAISLIFRGWAPNAEILKDIICCFVPLLDKKTQKFPDFGLNALCTSMLARSMRSKVTLDSITFQDYTERAAVQEELVPQAVSNNIPLQNIPNETIVGRELRFRNPAANQRGAQSHPNVDNDSVLRNRHAAWTALPDVVRNRLLDNYIE